jgi:hypothetical protein
MIKEQFGNKAQIFAVDALLLAVDFIDTYFFVLVNFVSWRSQGLIRLTSDLNVLMLFQLPFFLEDKHAILANE